MSSPVGALSRALLELTVGSQRARLAKELADAQNAGAEYVQHVKVPVDGEVGATPVETLQDVIFPLPIMYAPNQSPSSMPEPHFNYGVELPKGSVLPRIEPYLVGWITNDQAWFVGAHLRIAAYIPNAAKLTKFSATLHLTFYGWAAPPESSGDGRAASGGDDGMPLVGSGSADGGDGAIGGDPGTDQSTDGTEGPFRMLYPTGPLTTAGVTFSQVASWGPGSSIDEFNIPAGQGALKIANDGRLTAENGWNVNAYQGYPPWINELSAYRYWRDWTWKDFPFFRSTDTPPPEFIPRVDPPPGPVGVVSTPPPDPGNRYFRQWDWGSKYSAIWTGGGSHGGGYKLRAHMAIDPRFGDGNFDFDVMHAIVLNMTDEHNGLAFIFGRSCIGWMTDLRMLSLSKLAGTYIFNDSFEILIPWHDEWWVSGAESNAARFAGQQFKWAREGWVEVWRHHDNTITAGLWLDSKAVPGSGDPALGGMPVYISTIKMPRAPYHYGDGLEGGNVVRLEDYGPAVPGHWGWVRSHMNAGIHDFPIPEKWDPPGWIQPTNGLKSLTLFKEN